ncbi:serine hydrolase [Patiriisocius sp. Uisw_017]|jgi:CubicO group peptidase (beta-lactamase class C family)|uniref:serine hydrolase n=1 Tax=Patiriisocius sp. Uisw_017 TaxID=3230968 RepID=UPI0039E76A6F
MSIIIKLHLSLTLLILSFAAEGQPNISPQVPLEIETLDETLIQESHIPELSMAVRKPGRIIYVEGFGYAKDTIKMDSSIRTRTASVAKVNTTTVLGHLASQGKLNFDAPIKKHVPYIQPAYAPLT